MSPRKAATPTVPAARPTSGPPDAKINAQGFRTYRWPVTDPETGVVTERELLSVTSIRKLVGEPFGLVAWQIGKVIDRALSDEFRKKVAPRQIAAIRTLIDDLEPGAYSVTQVLEAIEITLADTADVAEFLDIPQLRKWLRAATTEERDAAASKGLDIHGALELGLAPEDCNEQTRPYVRQVHHFLAETGWKIVAQEFQCFNLAAGYAGTSDVIFQTPDGEYVLGDWKTSKSVYVDHCVQLMAYVGAEFVGLHGKVDARLTAMLNATRNAGILHLSATGWTWYDVPYSEEVMGAFFGSVRFARLLTAHPKGPDALFSGKRSGSAEL